jgi:hypothetical protein
VKEKGGQVDYAIGPIDVGGLRDRDLLATESLSDNV